MSPAVAVVILIAALALALDCFPQVHAATGGALCWVDYGCAWFFLMELGVRIRLAGWRSCLASSWNRFDLAVVLLSSPVLLLPVVDTRAFGVLLLLRLTRLARLCRVFSFVPQRERMLAGIGRALRVAAGAVVALGFLIFVAGVGGSLLFGEVLPDSFGNPLLGVWTMFRVFTVEGWHEVPVAVAASDAGQALVWAVRAWFGFFALVGGVIGLSLVNALLVDELVADNNDDVKRELAELRRDMQLLLQK